MHRFSSSLVVAALILCSYGASAGFREDEVYCEEAAARLAKCCPSFDPHTIECSFVDDSTYCSVHVQYPAIDEGTSKCILALDCGTMVSSGVCDRAARIIPRISEYADGGGNVTTGGSQSVCE